MTATTWVDHLRSGGTTTWADWPARESALGAEAGAASAEFLRRLNTARGGVPVPAPLAERILARALPGRGLPQVSLGAAVEDRELLRVGSGVLADLAGETEVVLPAERLWRRSGLRPTFVLEGAPCTVASLRARLASVGIFEHRMTGRLPVLGGRGTLPDLALIVAESFVAGLGDVWSARTQAGSARSWSGFVSRSRTRGVPPSLAYADLADHWAQRLGADSVHVLTVDGLFDQVELLLGRRPGSVVAKRFPGDPRTLPPAGVDVLRRVNTVLPFRRAAEEAVEIRLRLVSVLGAVQTGPPLLEVPDEVRDWAESAGVEMLERLSSGGHRVHGDLSSLLAWGSRRTARLRAPEVLDTMLQAVSLLAAYVPGEAA